MTKRTTNNTLSLLIGKLNTTGTQSILSLFLSTLKVRIGTKISLLSTFGLSLSINILNIGILQTLHAITESINRQTVSVSFSGFSEILFLTGPKFSNTGITLDGILYSLNFGKLGVNPIDLSLKAFRKSIRFSRRTDKIKETIRILDTLSLGQSL